MSRPLTPPEMVAFQQDTNYLDAGIPVWGSRVAIWTQNNNMAVLIYHTQNYGYTLNDITDFGQAKIAELARQSDVQGMWFYLPQSIQDVITDRAEQVATVAQQVGATTADILQAVATETGKTLQDLLAPVVDALLVPLVLVGAIAAIYLIKKG